MRILGIDVGITTGLAVFEDPDKVLHCIGLSLHRDGPAGITRSFQLAIETYQITHIAIELPILSPQSPMYRDLLNVSNLIQSQASQYQQLGVAAMKIVRPVTWKATPAHKFSPSQKPTHHISIHERDAYRIAYWYWRFELSQEQVNE